MRRHRFRDSGLKHVEGDPTLKGVLFLWHEIPEIVLPAFVRARIYDTTTGSLPLDHPATKRVQAMLDHLDDKARSNEFSELVSYQIGSNKLEAKGKDLYLQYESLLCSVLNSIEIRLLTDDEVQQIENSLRPHQMPA